MLVKQKKTTIKPPLDPKPYRVKEVRGTQITVVRRRQQKVRSKEKIKLLRDRWLHLRGNSTESENQEEKWEEEEGDYWFIKHQGKPQDDRGED